jgi:hypothetical protein
MHQGTRFDGTSQHLDNNREIKRALVDMEKRPVGDALSIHPEGSVLHKASLHQYIFSSTNYDAPSKKKRNLASVQMTSCIEEDGIRNHYKLLK